MEFNKLDDTDFPHIGNVDVYKRKVTFDYSQYDNVQMVIRCLNVPWDLGEVHVGQRTVSGIGNVVKFESDTERDNWFNARTYATTPEQAASGNFDGYAWETQYRQFHQEDEINIPLPFDVAAQFNYITVEYNPAPIDYERESGLLKWFYFSRAVESIAPNKTRCIVKRDTWQTYINRIKIPYMVLERGHAPMAATSVASYLKNPLENCKYLLNEDVTYGTLAKNSYSKSVVLNDDGMYAVIASSGNPAANWGSKDGNNWNTPTAPQLVSGQPSYHTHGLPAASLSGFLSAVNSQIPQFISTIKAVFFVSNKFLSIGNGFDFYGYTIYPLEQKNANFDLLDLAKNQFGYESKYADIAKLYTYPYAAIEVTDENGNSTLVKVEDTTGNLDILTNVSLAYPYVSIDARVAGIGGDKRTTLTFRNVNSHSFTFDGRWYEYLYRWQIPTFAVIQSAAKHNDYATHYDRVQRALDNSTAQTNALNLNAVQKTNADATANMSVTNTAVQNAANTSMNTTTNINLNLTNAVTNENAENTMTLANNVTSLTVNNEIDASYDSAAISSVGNVASGALSGAMNGAALGPVGAIAGAVSGLVGGAIGAVTTNMQAAVSNNLKSDNARLQNNSNYAGWELSVYKNDNMTGLQRSMNNSMLTISNDNNTTQTANNAGLMKANATRTKTAADRVANLTKSTADAAIANSIRNAGLQQPFEFGTFANGENSASKPQMISANIVTQNKDAISKAGDYFLRYGYAHEGNWEFDTFTVMPKFTFWKVSDVWVKGLDVPDLYMDEIRFFLLGGVTVWRKPEDIGNTSIYENV